MSHLKRRQHFVDPQVQGSLLVRALVYWLWGSITFAAIIFLYRIAPAWFLGTNIDSGIWFHFGPVVIASLVLLPVVMLNTLRFSNKFVGPLLRLRRSLRQLANGEHVEPIAFRDDDFWRDVADEFNALAARIQQADSKPSSNGETKPTTVEPAGDPALANAKA